MLFDNKAPEPPSPSRSLGTSGAGKDEDEIDKAIFHLMENPSQDIALVQNQGLEVDDDNEPAPENIPENSQVLVTTNLYPGQTWGWDGIDQKEFIIQTKKVQALMAIGLHMEIVDNFFLSLLHVYLIVA